MGLSVHVIECNFDPNIAPTSVGQHWVNTATGDIWFSVGTSTVGDWVKLDGDTDIKVNVSANDAAAGFLNGKLTAGTAITLTENNDGGNEDLEIAVDASNIDHGSLSGLSDDDHVQYLTETRHDALPSDNPHTVSFTQAVAADAGTDITAAEAEILTDGSNADTLHIHAFEDEQVKVSANDTTTGYLFDKVVAGSNIIINEINDGSNETLEINSTAVLDVDLGAVQKRRTTDFIASMAWQDITLDTTDIENVVSQVEADGTNTDRVIVKETGLYLISYGYTYDPDDSQELYSSRVRANDATVIPGSLVDSADDFDEFHIGHTFAAELAANDYVSLQIQQSTGVNSSTPFRNTMLMVVRMKGAKGDQGPAGVGSTIALQEGGVSVVNTPHDTIDFDDNDFNITDNGDGSATITTNTPTIVFGSEWQNAESLGESSTSSASYQQKLSMTTPSLPSGTYRIGWSYGWSGNSTGTDFEARIQENNSTTIMEHFQEPKDSGTDQYHRASGFIYRALSGIETFDLDYRSDSGGTTVWIRDARLEIWRVS